MPVSDVLLSARGCSACLAWAVEARRRGLNVEVDPLELEAEALWQAALERRILRAVIHQEAGTLIVRDAAGQRQVTADDWEEVARWQNR